MPINHYLGYPKYSSVSEMPFQLELYLTLISVPLNICITTKKKTSSQIKKRRKLRYKKYKLGSRITVGIKVTTNLTKLIGL